MGRGGGGARCVSICMFEQLTVAPLHRLQSLYVFKWKKRKQARSGKTANCKRRKAKTKLSPPLTPPPTPTASAPPPHPEDKQESFMRPACAAELSDPSVAACFIFIFLLKMFLEATDQRGQTVLLIHRRLCGKQHKAVFLNCWVATQKWVVTACCISQKKKRNK